MTGMKDVKANAIANSHGSQHQSTGEKEGKKKKKKSKKKKKKRKRAKDDQGFDAVDSNALVSDISPDDNDDELVVEGIVYNSTMYLLDKRSNIVYSGVRDEEGNLVRVGSWDPNEKTVVVDSTLTGTAPQLYPFQVDSADHCETPFEAYQDISLFLQLYAESVGKTKGNLSIYDPYFCAGSVVNNLNTLGYSQVYNKCEDFYEKQRKGRLPNYDVLVTNPPYSSDHVEKLFQFVSSKKANKCFVLLLPSYFCQRKYFKEFCEKTNLFFIVPSKRYRYRAPKGGRKSDSIRKDRKNAPFISFWYCALPYNTPFGERKKIFKKMKQSFVKYNIEAASRQNNLQHGSGPNSNTGRKKPRTLQLYEKFGVLPTYLLNDSGSNKTSTKRRRKS